MNKIIYLVFFIVLATGLIACTKTINDTTPLEPNFENLSRVQFYNASLSTTRNVVYFDGKPISVTPMVYTHSGSTATYTGSGVVYGLPAGHHTFLVRDSSSTATVQPQLVFSNFMQDNASYTVFTYDTVNAIKQITVQNNLYIPNDTTATIRFAHFAYRKAGLPGPVDLFSKRKNATVFSNVVYTTVTDYVGFDGNRADSLILRHAGTMNAIDTLVLTPTTRRNYTVVYRGRHGVSEWPASNPLPGILSSFISY